MWCRKRGKKLTKTNEEYVQELKELNKGITSLEKYVTARIRIKHKCLECANIWKTAPDSIVSGGTGCPACADRNRPGLYNNVPERIILYLIRVYIGYKNFLKVGLTVNLETRVKEYKTKIKGLQSISILYEEDLKGTLAFALEQEVINTFKKYIPPSKFSGHTECLEISEEVRILEFLTDKT